MQQQDDIAVIQKILQGQQSAYAILVARYQPYVYTLVMRYVNSRELAEELSQDVFVKAYRSLADFKGESRFSTWLYTIVNTTCLSHLRKKQDGTILLEQDKIISLIDQAGRGEKPLDKLTQQTHKQLISDAIKRLSADDAQLITLFYLAEQSIEEISLVLGLTATNVKVRLFRARQKLKEILTPVLKEYLL